MIKPSGEGRGSSDVAIHYDAIIVGSGYGGAAVACRLAEAGLRIAVLERGRRWQPESYPRKPDDPWVYDARAPERANGWFDVRLWRDMAVVQGAGVGGGSLASANVMMQPAPELFEAGWPPEITYETLKPWLDVVGAMLAVEPLPSRQATRTTEKLRDAAERLGDGARFKSMPLAVAFSDDWRPTLPDPFNALHAQSWVNRHGVAQGTCVHCGECIIGCKVQAKATLDLTYLAAAERNGAQVLPLHHAVHIRPIETGYRVTYEAIEKGGRKRGAITGTRLVLAAGSVGSTELLLKCRDVFKTLPKISRRLGYGWSGNGDVLTPIAFPGRDLEPTRGPTITAAVDYLDGKRDGQRFFVTDGGFPAVLVDILAERSRSLADKRRWPAFHRLLGLLVNRRDAPQTILPLLAQGLDAADGRLRLKRSWARPFAGRQLALEWSPAASAAMLRASIGQHVAMARAAGGDVAVPNDWHWLANLATVAPLGGCSMGTSAETGVVAHSGEVFGYPNLYVADGAIIPEALGVPPARTIAALGERIGSLIVSRG
jgi:cholesterol oxidase